MRLTFRVKLLLVTVALVAVAELLTVVALDRSLSAELTAQLSRRLEDQARGSIEWISAGRHPDEIAHRLSKIVAARVTVLERDGAVVGDSGALPDVDDGEVSVSVPTPEGLVIRLAAPLSDVNSTIRLLRRRLLLASAVVFALAVAVSLLVGRALARPLVAMRDAAHRIAEGGYDVELPPGPKDELGDLARSLKTLSAKLGQTEAMRREFVGDISHEIGTPLAAIQGYTETLLAGRTDAATSKEFLDVIHRHTRRIGRLVEDLQFLSALQSQTPAEPLQERVPLLQMARHVASTVKPRADEKGATVLLDVHDDAVVLGDPDHVERVLLNLVDNAVKYGRREHGKVTVRARRTGGGRVIVEVLDDGPGISAEHIARVFERFYRVDRGRSREAGGTGLGLAIVKQLAEAMGGTASVSSEAGQGAHFVVDLPAA